MLLQVLSFFEKSCCPKFNKIPWRFNKVIDVWNSLISESFNVDKADNGIKDGYDYVSTS